jgi:hypothetical protein
MRALHNVYFLKEDGLFFSSKALGLVFSATYLRGSFALFPLPAGFPPLIRYEKTAPLHQSLQKSPPSFLGFRLGKDLFLSPITSEPIVRRKLLGKQYKV